MLDRIISFFTNLDAETLGLLSRLRDVFKKMLDAFDDLFAVIRNAAKIMSKFAIEMLVGCCVFLLHIFEMGIASYELRAEYRRIKRGNGQVGNLDDEENEWTNAEDAEEPGFGLTVEEVNAQRLRDRTANILAQSIRLFLSTAGLGLAITMIVLLAIGSTNGFMIFLLPLAYCCLAASFLTKLIHARHKYHNTANAKLKAERKSGYAHAVVEFLGSLCVATGFVTIAGLIAFVPPFAGFILIITGVAIATSNSISELVEYLNKPKNHETRTKFLDYGQKIITSLGVLLGAGSILLLNVGLVSVSMPVLLALGFGGIALAASPYLYKAAQWVYQKYISRSNEKAAFPFSLRDTLALGVGATAVVLSILGFPWFVITALVAAAVGALLWPYISESAMRFFGFEGGKTSVSSIKASDFVPATPHSKDMVSQYNSESTLAFNSPESGNRYSVSGTVVGREGEVFDSKSNLVTQGSESETPSAENSPEKDAPTHVKITISPPMLLSSKPVVASTPARHKPVGLGNPAEAFGYTPGKLIPHGDAFESPEKDSTKKEEIGSPFVSESVEPKVGYGLSSPRMLTLPVVVPGASDQSKPVAEKENSSLGEHPPVSSSSSSSMGSATN